MTATRPLSPGFLQNLNTTNKLWPDIKNDGIIKLIAKVALIVFTFGTIFLATIVYDLTTKLISRFRPTKPQYPSFTGIDKYKKYGRKILEGAKGAWGAISYIPDTTARYFYGHQNPYNYIGKTAGFALSTTALLTAIGGKYGALTGVILNGYGLLSKPLEEAYNNVMESVWPQTDIE